MKAIFKRVSSNEIVLWSFVAIDYNHVEFSLILTEGTYIKLLFLKTINETEYWFWYIT